MKKLIAIFGFGAVAISTLLLNIILIILLIVFGLCGNGGNNSQPGVGGNLSEKVMQYMPLVQKYAAKYEVTEYVNLILCVMMGESGGEGSDPMQAAEGGFNTQYPHVPNGIADPEYSVECGVQEVKESLRLAGAKGQTDLDRISLALQGYNYGPGYISWAQTRGGYTKENAIEFSEMMKLETGWDVYGNPEYVPRIMVFYLPFLTASPGGGPDDGTWAWPLPGYGMDWVTCWFGEGGHNGFDIAAPGGTPIVASRSGTVISAEYHDSWGNNVFLEHDDTYGTRYAHMTSWAVIPGQQVRRGQIIGYVGNTGNSFGDHLHFEVYQNGIRIDPYPFIRNAIKT
ncbi:MAG: lysozyme family protein [Oscillospiraceae bacterium]